MSFFTSDGAVNNTVISEQADYTIHDPIRKVIYIYQQEYVSQVAGPDGSFILTGVCNPGVPGSNPGRDGYLSSWLCIAVFQTKAWSAQCRLW